MISSLLKLVMKECGLTQQGIADVMGVNLDRVKSITSGKVQKLTREEGEALITKLNISGNWLATGQPPMFRSETEQRAAAVMDQFGSASKTAKALSLSAEQGRLVMELMFFAQTGDAAAARRTLAEMMKPDMSALELAIEYARNREQLEKKKLSASAFAHAVRLAYEITLDEKQEAQKIDSSRSTTKTT